MNFFIQIAMVICPLVGMHADQMKCRDLDWPTGYVSTVQCEIFGQQQIAQAMKEHPGWMVSKYKCELVKPGRDA